LIDQTNRRSTTQVWHPELIAAMSILFTADSMNSPSSANFLGIKTRFLMKKINFKTKDWMVA
jgi:hypothetical protein